MSLAVQGQKEESRNDALARICFWVATTFVVFGTVCYLSYLAGAPSLGLSYLGWLAVPYGLGYLAHRRRG